MYKLEFILDGNTKITYIAYQSISSKYELWMEINNNNYQVYSGDTLEEAIEKANSPYDLSPLLEQYKKKDIMTLVEAFQIVRDRYGDVTLEHAFNTNKDWIISFSDIYNRQCVIKVSKTTKNGIITELIS